MALHTTLASSLVPTKLGTIIFYGWESMASAKAMAVEIRSKKELAFTRDAHTFTNEAEFCKSVVIMSDVHPKARSRIEAAYGDKVISTVEAPKPEPVIDPVAPPEGDHTELAQSIKRRPGRPRKEVILEDQSNG